MKHFKRELKQNQIIKGLLLLLPSVLTLRQFFCLGNDFLRGQYRNKEEGRIITDLHDLFATNTAMSQSKPVSLSCELKNRAKKPEKRSAGTRKQRQDILPVVKRRHEPVAVMCVMQSRFFIKLTWSLDFM